jgi:hypothetical protein
MTHGVTHCVGTSREGGRLSPRWPDAVRGGAASVGVALGLAGTACVPKANYDRLLADAASAKAAGQAKQNADAARIQSLDHQVADGRDAGPGGEAE